jgi:hypothetical protein
MVETGTGSMRSATSAGRSCGIALKLHCPPQFPFYLLTKDIGDWFKPTWRNEECSRIVVVSDTDQPKRRDLASHAAVVASDTIAEAVHSASR